MKIKAPIKGQIAIVIFQENRAWIAYSPDLDLAGYGLSESEAKRSFKVNLEEFFAYAIEHNTLQKELKRLGWAGEAKIAPRASSLEELLRKGRKNEELGMLMKRPLDRPVSMIPFPVTFPQFAHA
jgi:hypothetical protein